MRRRYANAAYMSGAYNYFGRGQIKDMVAILYCDDIIEFPGLVPFLENGRPFFVQMPTRWSCLIPGFDFLATRVAEIDTDKQVISTYHKDAVCTQARDVDGLAPCSHEEADTRILLHVQDAVRQGYTKVSIHTVDTDVTVLAVTAAGCLDIEELWVAFGRGKKFRFLAAHKMAVALGPNKCQGLPFFHALIGCDTVSSFGGWGKKKAWETWKTCDEVTDVTAAFCALAATSTPSAIDDHMDALENILLLCSSSQEHVNECRKHLFTLRMAGQLMLSHQLEKP